MKMVLRTLSLGLLLAATGAYANTVDGLGFSGPERDARPGDIYFYKGVEAVRHKDYRFAVQMYEAAASWAHKTAQYNLAIMYLRGEGVPVDKPRAMAWIALAAERGDEKYVQARELIYANLTAEEFTRANEIWRELKSEYADETALRRATTRWLETRREATGSHVGFVGNMVVGADESRAFAFPVPNLDPTKPEGRPDGRVKGHPDGFATSALGFTGGHQTDGTISYRNLQETDNPYDPRFRQGIATVEPIIPPGSDEHDGTRRTPPADKEP